MPIYEYQCDNCLGDTVEDYRTIDARDHEMDCLQCGCVMKRLVARDILPIIPYGRMFVDTTKLAPTKASQFSKI